MVPLCWGIDKLRDSDVGIQQYSTAALFMAQEKISGVWCAGIRCGSEESMKSESMVHDLADPFTQTPPKRGSSWAEAATFNLEVALHLGPWEDSDSTENSN